MDGYGTINQVLVKLFQDIMNIEEKAIITDQFHDITNNDMHVIEAIGIEEPRNMSTVARALSVTVGTLTISVNNLVKKGYVIRRRSEEDRRVVLVSLSDKGRAAYFHHQEFHNKMVQAILADLNEDQTEALVRALNNLLEFFQSYSQRSSYE